MDQDERFSGATNEYRKQFPRGPDGRVPFAEADGSGEVPIWQDDGELNEQEQRTRDFEGLYAVLNLPKSATTAQIRDRYRQLAILFHPDKQPSTSTLFNGSVPQAGSSSSSSSSFLPDGSSTADAEDHRHPYEIDARPVRRTRKEAAESQFAEIQRAYEVLIDPQRRAVYDLLGEEGLKTNWEVGKRGQSPEEIKRQFQRQAYEKRLASIESMVKSKGVIQCSLDARAVFLSKKFFADPSVVPHDPLSRLQRLRVGQLLMKHEFSTSLNERTQVVWAGQMLSRNGAGGGNVVGTVRHQFGPKVWMEVGSSVLNPRVGTAKATVTFTEDSFLTVNAVQQTIQAPPGLTVTYGRKAFGNVTGFTTVRSGFWNLGPWGRGLAATLGRNDQPALTVGLTSQDEHGTGWTVETTGGALDRHISLDYSIKVLDGVRVKIGGSLATNAVSAFVNGERQLTDMTRFGLGVTASLPGGVSMKIRLWRLGQRVVIPIMLSPDLNPAVLFFSTVLPATSMVALNHFYIVPRRRRRTRDRLRRLQRENAEFTAQKRAEALDAIALMTEHAQRRADQERASEGLVIIAAQYGLSDAFSDGAERFDVSDKVFDVTIPLQALVQNGTLYIPEGRSKANLLGFYDPCIGEPKSLKVAYLFRNRMHEAIIDDLATLRAPLRGHAVTAGEGREETWEA